MKRVYLQLTGVISIKRISSALFAFTAAGILWAAFLYTPARAATTYTWNQTGTASWATSTNWTPNRLVSLPDDILVFNNSSTTTVTNVPTETIGQLLVSNNTTVNLQASAAVTLTIAGGGGPDLDVQAGSALNCNTTNAITIAVGTGATGSIFGTMTFSAGAATNHSLTAADASGITFNTGSVFTQGTNNTGNVFGTTGAQNTILFASGSTFDQKAGSNPFGLSEPNSKVVFQTGSLFRITASSVNASYSGRTYANFEMNAASSIQSATGTSALLMDKLTVTAGTFNFNMTSTPGHAIKGDISVASGATLTFSPGAAGTVNLNGVSAQTISGAGTLTINSTQTISVANTTGVTLQRDVATSGPFNVVSGGVLNCGTSVLSGNGTFNLQPNGTLGIGSADGITTFPNATGNIRNLNRIYNSAGNYTYNGTVAQNTGNGLPTNITGVLTNSNTSAPVTLVQNTTLNGGVSIPVSTDLRIGSGVTLTSNINPTIGGTLSGGNSASTFIFTNTTLTNNGTISVANTTFDRSVAGNQDVQGAGAWTGTGTLTFAGAGDTVTLKNSINVSAGTLLISSATLDISTVANLTLTFGGTTFTNNGSFTPGTTSTVVFNRAGTTTLDGSSGTTFNNQTINSGTTLQLSTGANPTINNTITINGTIVMPDTLTVASDGAATLTMGSNGLIQTADSDGVTDSASTSFGTGFTTTSIDTNGTVEYNRSVAGTQTVTDRNYNSLTITGGTSTKSWSLGATRTVNGTVTINSGSLFNLSGNQTLNIKGDWNNSAGSGFLTNCFVTVVFNGSTNQSMGGSTFSSFCHVTVSTNGTLTLNMTIGGINVSGSLIISSGSTLNANNKNITVAGAAFTNDGTYTAGGVNQQFNITSASAFVIGGTSSTTFGNLTNNNAGAGTTTIVTSATVTGNLQLDDDITVSSPAILTQSGTSINSSAGAANTRDLIGTVRRTDLDSTAKAFGNPFNTIKIDSGTAPTEMTVTLVKSEPTGNNVGFSTAVKRTYTLTPTGGSGYSATLRLHYSIADDSELNSNVEGSASFDLWRHDGVTTWQRQVKTSSDTTNNWLEKTGVTQFSLWTMAGSNPAGPAPTAVRLTRFDAVSYADGVQLSWDSGFEVNNLGYHVYREQNGKRTRVTPSVVAGSALTVGQGSRLTAGYSYSWFDPQGTPDAVYSLEAIDLDGSRQWAGPIHSSAGSTTGSPRRQRTKLLNELVSTSDSSSSVDQISEWPAAVTPDNSSPVANDRDTYLSSDKVNRHNAPPQSTGIPRNETKSQEQPESRGSSLAIQQAIAAGKAVKIQIRKPGWYRVTQAELVAAGLDPASDANLLQLFVNGEEVAISLSAEGSQLRSTDTIEFYGVPLDTPTTDTQTYWLIVGTTAGKRVLARRTKIKPSDQNSEPAPGSFDLTVERRERLLYVSNLLNGEAENLFGAPIFDELVNQTLNLRNVDRDSPSQPQIEVALQGLSFGNHRVELQLNGGNLGTMTFSGREHAIARFSLNPARLVEGNNVVTLISTNGSSDVSAVDWLRLTYPRQYTAENNSLKLSVPGGQPLRIHGFSSPNVRVIDVTEPDSPVQLPASAAALAGSYSVRVQPSGNGHRILIAFTDDLSAHPAAITANRTSSWHSHLNGADMVIITHRDFSQAIDPLAALRRNQGLKVAVVDVEDVYDEFSFGAHTPVAIKDFLKSAAANWTRKPQYLLLVGDSSWDPRNYLGQGANDFVPTKLIDTGAMETGSDDWLADFNDVGLANLAVGRLPARTAAEVNLMVSKILSFEHERELNAPLRGAVMVADKDFEPQSAKTAALLPNAVTVQSINRAAVGNDDVMRGQVVDALNQGPMVVNYYGHGSVRVWTSAGLLNSSLATSLTNANSLSLYVMMTCLNGYASDANIDSLAEAALKAPNGGAVAVWASSGFTTPPPQFEMNTEFYRLLFGGQPMRLGDAIRSAKAATTDMDVRRTWVLLGDPAMRIR